MITAMNVTQPRRVRRPLRWLSIFIASLAAVAPFSQQAAAQQDDERPANLLRNGQFQDDWMTHAPQTKTLHLSFSSEYQNRRDYNPDGWWSRGSWRWENADGPAGSRRFFVTGPKASVTQRVNLFALHDDRKLGGFMDGGEFPLLVDVRSREPLNAVRDMTLRLKIKGDKVPEGAASATLNFVGAPSVSVIDPLGTDGPVLHSASAKLPAGTYDWKWIEVRIRASDWLDAVAASVEKNPKLVAEYKTSGVPLPTIASVAINYEGTSGEIEIAEAQLLDAALSPKNFSNPPVEKGTPGAPKDADELAPNLLVNGNFEAGSSELDDPTAPTAGPRTQAMNEPMPMGWSRAIKQAYVSPRPYYGFNTWHNRGFDNAGFARLDPLTVHDGQYALQIVVPPGDETSVWSDAIKLNQTEAKLIEVSAWIKTDKLNMFDIVGYDQDGQRLDGFIFSSKAPHSVGTEDWRVVRQVFRPRKAASSIRVALQARGVNGYTLADTGSQPQANVVGTIWWDDLTVREIESTSDELKARGVKFRAPEADKSANLPRPWGHRADLALTNVDFGDRLPGDNIFRATLINPGRRDIEATISLDLFNASAGAPQSNKPEQRIVPARGKIELVIPYSIAHAGAAYTTFGKGVTIQYKDESGPSKTLSTKILAATWPTPIMVRLGETYLRPEQTQQLVRINLGFAGETMKRVTSVRLDVVRRETGDVIKSVKIPATPTALAKQREKIPTTIYDDFANLLLADVDVSALPVQPFSSPERAWVIRVTACDSDGAPVLPNLSSVDSDPFCRLAHQGPQQPISKVEIKNRLLYVNGQPWMPFSAMSASSPVHFQPLANVREFRNLNDLPGWPYSAGLTTGMQNRQEYDFNGNRTTPAPVNQNSASAASDIAWSEDNRYTPMAWLGAHPGLISVEQLNAVYGNESAKKVLDTIRTSPYVVSTNPGVDEVVSHFIAFKPEAIASLKTLTEHIRKNTGRPVSVGYGASLHRAEFERVPFFDIYEIGTAPFGPAPLHVDFWPALGKQDAVAWIHPEIFESVPYERLRYHVFVEMMRGARGWEFVHGTGDPSLLRGLHGEVECMKPVLYSNEPGAKTSIEPAMEMFSRGYDGKTYVIASTTRGMSIGSWRWADEATSLGITWTPKDIAGSSLDMNARAAGRPRVTQAPIDDQGVPTTGPVNLSGIDNLPGARTWPTGTKLVQWVKLEARASGAAGNTPRNLVIIPKADARITQAAAWGTFDAAPFTANPSYAFAIVRVLYRNAAGLIGWDVRKAPLGYPFLPSTKTTTAMGDLPPVGQWTKLEIPLEKISADKKLIDGCVFMHEGGRVLWGKTSLIAPDGTEQVIWGSSLIPPAAELAQTQVKVAGLKSGDKVRVLFEDRTITAKDGYFVDDFRGSDLYQRYGGFSSHGNLPVALHVYEIPVK